MAGEERWARFRVGNEEKFEIVTGCHRFVTPFLATPKLKVSSTQYGFESHYSTFFLHLKKPQSGRQLARQFDPRFKEERKVSKNTLPFTLPFATTSPWGRYLTSYSI